MFYADLHVHSKYSRACSRDCDLEHLAWWGARKGIRVLGTGDFCHPAWNRELHEKLEPAEPGLYRLRPEFAERVARTLPPQCRLDVRFMLSVEISTIYKRDDRTRKVHHLLYAPDLDAAGRIASALDRIGNISSDGRPILGLDSRDLLDITLSSDPGAYLVPAHAWTPWFSVLGSKSGFDQVADCYADLAGHIFAVETGLSSDPPMNWRVGSLDAYTLVSNSDAHSPPALGREATAFGTDVDYFAMRRALETGERFGGTVEFFPEEGKYHMDGHRKCGVRLDPAVTRTGDGRCPECRRPLTIGVLHRVEALADRPDGHRPPRAAPFHSLIPLPEMVSEILGVGPKSKKVVGEVGDLVARLGPELSILTEVPVDDVAAAGGTLLGEAVARLRRGEVIREGGYDGEYGVIRVFARDELHRSRAIPALFAVAMSEPEPAPEPVRTRAVPPRAATADATDASDAEFTEALFAELGPPRPGAGLGIGADAPAEPEPEPEPRAAEPLATSVPGQMAIEDVGDSGDTGALLDGLDPDQRAAAAAAAGPLLIIAGPGTGKTRTLTYRVAAAVRERGVPPEQCLAITFTRRAAQEMRERLAALVPGAARMTVTTFHGLGAAILREMPAAAGLTPDFRIADEAERLAVASELAGGAERDGRKLLAALDDDPDARERFEKALRARDLADFDDLIRLPVRLLREDPQAAARLRDRWRWISVDEYQDVDAAQYDLLALLAGDGAGLTAIGDPDQAIYGFRGADVRFFLRFTADYPDAAVVTLGRNYRSSAAIVSAAAHAIAPETLVAGRELTAMRHDLEAVPVGVYGAADPDAEAAFIVSSVEGLLGGSSFHSLDSGRVTADGHGGIAFADIAILYRTDAQAEMIMTALTRAGLPFQKRAHDRLAARPGVEEIAAELPHHGAGPLAARVRAAAEAVAVHRAAANADTEPVAAAAELLMPLAGRCGDDLDRFLAELALGAEVDAYDPRAEAIALLTLHAAKGLEFPVVFVAGCERDLLPFRPVHAGPETRETAEERRLFFVGLTRAQERLYVSYAARRTRQGATRETGPSPFLSAIPGPLTRRLDAGARQRPKDRQLRLL